MTEKYGTTLLMTETWVKQLSLPSQLLCTHTHTQNKKTPKNRRSRPSSVHKTITEVKPFLRFTNVYLGRPLKIF
jgi:hypothetical protein